MDGGSEELPPLIGPCGEGGGCAVMPSCDCPFDRSEITPQLGDVVLDEFGGRAQCIATPTDRRHARTGAIGWLQTRYVFRRSPGYHWCVDQPRGSIVPRTQRTAAERVYAVLLHGRDLLFDFIEEEWRRDDMYELALIEAVLGVDDIREEYDLWDEPDHLDRWQILARAFDGDRPTPSPSDAEAVL